MFVWCGVLILTVLCEVPRAHFSTMLPVDWQRVLRGATLVAQEVFRMRRRRRRRRRRRHRRRRRRRQQHSLRSGQHPHSLLVTPLSLLLCTCLWLRCLRHRRRQEMLVLPLLVHISTLIRVQLRHRYHYLLQLSRLSHQWLLLLSQNSLFFLLSRLCLQPHRHHKRMLRRHLLVDESSERLPCQHRRLRVFGALGAWRRVLLPER